MVRRLFRWVALKFKGQSRRMAWLVALCLGHYPSSTDRLGSLWFPVFGLKHDFSSGHAVVPLEEIFPGMTIDSEADVTRHALRIIEQHYVQRERFHPARMLSSAVRALARDHGGDIELAFLKQSSEFNRLQLSSHRTIQLCPSTTRQSAEICPESGVVSVPMALQESSDMQIVLRVGLRVFGISLSVEPGLRSLDLVGRFVVPEYARLRGVPLSSAIHTYLNGILDELDPHSSYMTQDEYRELRSGTRGQFGGVGLVIDESQELPVIREVVPNSPAHMAGIRPGDVLLKVGKHLSAFRSLEGVLRDVRELAVDTAAPVWLFRPSSRRVYRAFLAREEIPTRSVEMRIVEGHPDVLHIRVTGFSNHTAEDVYALFEHAQLSARGRLKMVLLDLRGNPGGLLDQAIQVSDLFIRQGRIVSTRSRFEEQIEQATRGIKIDLPVVVLVNSSSASASEIVVGALKDHGRALVVGERTFGKGSVQSLFELSTGTALKLTVAHYFTPASQSLQGVGVEPHISVKLVQPHEDYFWMSGSSEFDREEHLASHLLNPVNKKNSTSSAHQLMLNMWTLANSEGQILEGLRPLNFAYPTGDNTQTLTRLDEDPVARVGVNLGHLLFMGRPVAQTITEKQIRDAHRKIVTDEAMRLREFVEKKLSPSNSVWKMLPKAFFDVSPDDASGSSQRSSHTGSSAGVTKPRTQTRESTSGLRNLISLFGGKDTASSGSNNWGALFSKVSMSAHSLIAMQGPQQVLLSMSPPDWRGSQRSGAQVALFGVKLDESHDGPVVWVPARFTRSPESQQWVATVRLPKAVRSYLSTIPVADDRPSIVGQLKWRLGDDPVVIGQLQLPAVAKRHGRLTGRLNVRGDHQLLQVHFVRQSDSLLNAEDALQGLPNAASESSPHAGPLELLVATLSDGRVKVVSEVVPLQKVADGEYRGETELKLSPVKNRGLGFSGLVGGIVRSNAGDVLSSAPLLWVGDEGVYPLGDIDDRGASSIPPPD